MAPQCAEHRVMCGCGDKSASSEQRAQQLHMVILVKRDFCRIDEFVQVELSSIVPQNISEMDGSDARWRPSRYSN
jgi:hypothetical protein